MNPYLLTSGVQGAEPPGRFSRVGAMDEIDRFGRSTGVFDQRRRDPVPFRRPMLAHLPKNAGAAMRMNVQASGLGHMAGKDTPPDAWGARWPVDLTSLGARLSHGTGRAHAPGSKGGAVGWIPPAGLRVGLSRGVSGGRK